MANKEDGRTAEHDQGSMTETYGRCISFDQAITWAEGQPDSTVKEYALNRMRYERDKARPVPPKFHKGKYGHMYDSWSCGNCGAGIPEGKKVEA